MIVLETPRLRLREFLPAIVGRARQENTGSIRVLEKIGLTFIRHLEFDGRPGVLYKIENPQADLKTAT